MRSLQQCYGVVVLGCVRESQCERVCLWETACGSKSGRGEGKRDRNIFGESGADKNARETGIVCAFGGWEIAYVCQSSKSVGAHVVHAWERPPRLIIIRV